MEMVKGKGKGEGEGAKKKREQTCGKEEEEGRKGSWIGRREGNCRSEQEIVTWKVNGGG